MTSQDSGKLERINHSFIEARSEDSDGGRHSEKSLTYCDQLRHKERKGLLFLRFIGGMLVAA